MYCTFYRPTMVNTKEFENIVGKLHWDLHLLGTKKQDEWCIYQYVYSLTSQSLERTPGMRFLGLGNPKEMPHDARVQYFYLPTYLATAFIMKAVLKYPSLLSKAAFLDSDLDFSVDMVKENLSALMRGCTCCGFNAEILEIFRNADTALFLEKYPNICPEFSNLYNVVSKKHK